MDRENSEIKAENSEIDQINHNLLIYIQSHSIRLHFDPVRQHLT